MVVGSYNDEVLKPGQKVLMACSGHGYDAYFRTGVVDLVVSEHEVVVRADDTGKLNTRRPDQLFVLG